MGIGAAVAAGVREIHAENVAVETKDGEMMQVRLDINGRQHKLLVEPRWSLLFVIREKLGITATKVGCERGECGACTVLIDGIPRYACMILAPEAEGHEITTLEGLMNGEELGPVQQAFVEHDAFQCGYCTSGQINAAEGLLRQKAHPTNQEIREGMAGNLCRCGAYAHIFKAVEKAAELKQGKKS
jgi:xanthine dehydrogenase YagT iron-sulfur-binding subunit